MQTIKLFAITLLLSLLSACEQPSQNYDYLMQHPNVLQSKAEECANAADTDQACVDVKKAARDFMDLVNERSKDPEQFGQKIMSLQNQIAVEKNQDKNQQAKQQLAVLYAVVAATSAE